MDCLGFGKPAIMSENVDFPGFGRKRLLRSTKLFFEFAKIHFNQRGAAMGAGVGHGATAQIVDEVFQFRAGEGIVGFDGVAADGFSDGMFAEAQGVYVLAGGFEFVHKFEDEFARVGNFDEGRQGIEEKGAFAEFAQADAEASEGGQLFADEIGVARGEFDGFREQEFLRIGLLLLLEAIEHLFEKNAFVRGVLIEQNQPAIGFEDDVESADDADEAQGNAQERKRGEGGVRGEVRSVSRGLWCRGRGFGSLSWPSESHLERGLFNRVSGSLGHRVCGQRKFRKRWGG